MPTLKELRESSSRSRARVAADMDMSERHLSRLEVGHSPLHQMHRLAFAQYFGVEPDAIEAIEADRSAA